jgi:uncharacterized protein YndB with AHSA1/START domain
MKNDDFKPVVGHDFAVTAFWGAVACQVRSIEPNRTLCYTWDTKDLQSVVTWTLTPTDTGTRLRMVQSGFRTDQEPYYRGAQAGWPRFFAKLEVLLARME